MLIYYIASYLSASYCCIVIIIFQLTICMLFLKYELFSCIKNFIFSNERKTNSFKFVLFYIKFKILFLKN